MAMYRGHGAGAALKRLERIEQQAMVTKEDAKFLADIGFGEGTRLLPYNEMITRLKVVYTPRAVAERLLT